jgi:hypothetical protein
MTLREVLLTVALWFGAILVVSAIVSAVVLWLVWLVV